MCKYVVKFIVFEINSSHSRVKDTEHEKLAANFLLLTYDDIDSKVHGANMGPTWVLSAPDGPRVGPMNLAIRDIHKLSIPDDVTGTTPDNSTAILLLYSHQRVQSISNNILILSWVHIVVWEYMYADKTSTDHTSNDINMFI